MKHTTSLCLLIALYHLAACSKPEKAYDASGTFEAEETIISAEANGKILQLRLEEGQHLDSGDVVGYLDSMQAHLDKQQLLQNKKAILSGRPETNVQLQALQAELAHLLLERNRTENLVKTGIAAQRQLDDANAQIAALEARIAGQQSTLKVSTSSLNEQGGSVDAQMAELNDRLKKYVIVNPVSGTVLTKYASSFEMATVGKPLYKIANLSTIILRAYITGDQLQQVKPGQAVRVSTDDGNGGYKDTEGIISWINSEAEFTPKTIQTKNERANLVYAIKVRVKNDGFLKIGMYGQVSWQTP